jgi:hypothetical protein
VIDYSGLQRVTVAAVAEEFFSAVFTPLEPASSIPGLADPIAGFLCAFRRRNQQESHVYLTTLALAVHHPVCYGLPEFMFPLLNK